jgi:signal transduction histidine kinase
MTRKSLPRGKLRRTPPEIVLLRRESFVDAGRILNGTVIAIVAAAVVYFALSDPFNTADWWRSVLVISLLAAAVAANMLVRTGRGKLAAALLSAALWTSVTIFVFVTGFGLHSATVFIYVPAILYVALLLGVVPAAAQTLVTLLALVVMYWAEETGHITGVHAFIAGTTNFNFLLGVMAVCVASLVIAVVYQRAIDHAARRTLHQMDVQQHTLDELHRTQSELEAAHAEVLALNATLEQRVADRTHDLERTVRDLESFSYSISHDLRAPLRAINGFAAILQREHAAGLSLDAQQALGRIRAASDRMDALVNALLDLVKLGRHVPMKEHIDLSVLVTEIAARFVQTSHGSAIEYRIAAGVHATADRQLLGIALENLLANAAKFASVARAPVVEFGTETVGETIAYFVRDNGVGFDPRYVTSLFKPFHRLHSEAEFDGIGMGLAAVRLIVERHGGDVWAEGKPGEGAKFSFTLAVGKP